MNNEFSLTNSGLHSQSCFKEAGTKYFYQRVPTLVEVCLVLDFARLGASLPTVKT